MMPKTVLTYSSLAIACLVVIAVFITTTTYTQLAAAILLYPLLAYFALKAFPRKTRISPSRNPVTEVPPLVKSAETVEGNKRESVGISDIDKRVFLKLIGGAGVSLFLYSIFNKKAEGLFFKGLPASGTSGSVSLQDIAGNKIDPSQKKPLDGYSISDIENGIIAFYGFISKDSSWYIMRLDISTGAFRYTKDKSNFRANWSNRANLKYDYFDNVFR